MKISILLYRNIKTFNNTNISNKCLSIYLFLIICAISTHCYNNIIITIGTYMHILCDVYFQWFINK